MFLTSLYKNQKNEKLWKFPLFEGFSPQLIYILKCLISQWIVFIVYYQISIIILVYHSWLTRKRPISNETPGLEYRRVHLNSIVKKWWNLYGNSLEFQLIINLYLSISLSICLHNIYNFPKIIYTLKGHILYSLYVSNITL